MHRQLDVSLFNTFTIEAPRSAVLTPENFIFFHIPTNVDPKRYTVVVESLDNSGPRFRSIGLLAKSVQLPLVRFGTYPKLALVPDSANLPRFNATLIRGSTYVVPAVNRNGDYSMERYGSSRLN